MVKQQQPGRRKARDAAAQSSRIWTDDKIQALHAAGLNPSSFERLLGKFMDEEYAMVHGEDSASEQVATPPTKRGQQAPARALQPSSSSGVKKPATKNN